MACEIHKYHAPVPQGVHSHHIIPLAWTSALGIRPSRTIELCPTGHDNAHRDLRNAIAGRPWRAGKLGSQIVKEAFKFYQDHPLSQHMLRTTAEELIGK